MKTSLEQLSPSLYRALERCCEKKGLDLLVEAFEYAVAHGGCTEHGVRRSEGVSFNPRPARICQIVLTDCAERRPEFLAAALLVACNERSASQALEDANALALQARIFLESEHSESDCEHLALALLLDEFRHLHMTSLSSGQIRERLDWVKEKIFPRVKQPNSERLKVMLQATIDRLERLQR